MTADTVGGVWTYALELSRGLGSHGCEVLLATMGEHLSAAQREEAGRIPNVTVCESRFKLEWMEDPWRDVSLAGDWLLEQAERFGPDVIHLNGYAHAALAWPAPVLVAAHSCVLSWWKAVKNERAPACWDPYREAVQRGLAAADAVVAPSHAMAAALRAHYATTREVQVIPNGRRTDAFRPAFKRNFVLAAGRAWDEAKNLRALDRVAPGLPWPVYVAGDGAAEFHAARPLGRLEAGEMSRWYGEAAIYCLPALYEPFGLSVLEAALAGCALVLGGIQSLHENWTDAAVFVPPGDDAALERALHALISDPHRRAGLRARARARAFRFAPERMASGYMKAYRDAVSGTERLCA